MHLPKKCAKNQRKRRLRPPDVPYHQTINKIFPPEWIEETAKETGMVKRLRSINPVVFFWTLVLDFGININRTITGLQKSYGEFTDRYVVYSSFYDRFNPSLVRFLREAVNKGLEEISNSENIQLSEKIGMFKDVNIIDSTVMKLHDGLASKWPACRTNTGKAACKLSVVLSVKGDGPKSIKLSGERKGEVKTISIGPWVEGRLLMFDLGFFKYQLFDRINRNKGFFLTRLKNNTNPFVIAENRRWRGNSISLAGEYIKDVLPKLKREVIDAEVEVSFSRRPYAGKKSKASQNFRIVGVMDDETKEHHLYITNIPPEMMAAEDIAALYSYRWTIELLMKELKSTYKIHVLPFDNKNVVEAFIYTGILTLIISRRLLSEVRATNPEYADRIPRLRWANTFARMSTVLCVTILEEAGIGNPKQQQMDLMVEMAVDPNKSRKRLDDDWIDYGGC